MFDKFGRPKPWATRVRSESNKSLASDLKALGVNVAQCKACQGRGFALKCAAEAVNRFMAPRFVSTLVVVVAALAVLGVLL